MMERCCSILAYENLPDGKATVGFEVHVKHVAAAGEGSAAPCTRGWARWSTGASCASSVEVREGERTIGVGTARAAGRGPGRLRQLTPRIAAP